MKLFAAFGGRGALAPVMAAALTACAAQPARSPSPRTTFDPGVDVNAELRPALAAMPKDAANDTLSGESLPRFRSMLRTFTPPPLEQPVWTERTIPGPAESPEVKILIINAGSGTPLRPALLQIHGGGMVMADARWTLRAMQEIARDVNCVIVSVDYRLSPESPFPGPLEDSYAALKWLHDHAGELGADATRIALMGESSGGGLAAMVAIAARDRRAVPVAFELLTAPMLDDRTGSTRQVPGTIGKTMWTAPSNEFAWTAFLGRPAGSATVPYGSVPARVEDLRGLPPTFISVGSIDLFVDEDVEYARRLIDAGVPTELHVIAGAFHGFQVVAPQSDVAKDDRRTVIKALSRALSATPAP